MYLTVIQLNFSIKQEQTKQVFWISLHSFRGSHLHWVWFLRTFLCILTEKIVDQGNAAAPSTYPWNMKLVVWLFTLFLPPFMGMVILGSPPHFGVYWVGMHGSLRCNEYASFPPSYSVSEFQRPRFPHRWCLDSSKSPTRIQFLIGFEPHWATYSLHT